MKHALTLSLIASTALLLSGCGGGGSTPPAAAQSTGSVADGYIEDAYVCHDNDADWDCLDEADYATTAADGSFTLANYDATRDLIVQIPVGAVDNGPFADGSTTPRPFASATWYLYPAGAAPQNGPVFIGPMSTLVAQAFRDFNTTLDDAIGIVSTQTGIDPNDLMGNYIENNTTTTIGTGVQFVAEIVGTALTGNSSASGTNAEVVLQDLGNIVTTANSNDPATYDTGSYTTQTPSVTTALNYQGVSDLHTLLEACGLKAFEEWDGGSAATPNEHKELCLGTDADTGDRVLHYTEKYYSANTWTLDTVQTSGQVGFLSRPADTLIDMDHVNSGTQAYTYPLRFFPAVEQSHAGANATFKSGILEYKLIVSEADINTLSGATLPQGSSLAPLIDNVTFGTGDKIYKATMLTQAPTYVVDNGHNFLFNTTTSSTRPHDFIVYDEGTVGGADFTPMPNSTGMTTLLGLTDTDFIVNYKDSNNFRKLSITSPYNANGINMLHIEHISNGSNGGTIQSSAYTLEVHNGEAFLVVPNFYGMNKSLFIGKVNSISSTGFIYGKSYPAYATIDVTQGGYQNGDIMDDIMLNTSARDRVLNAAGIALP